jgi:putative ABC transport system ATP-binding protein
VAIPRPLNTNPALLLPHEPTGNLDSKSSNEILALFEQLNQQGITVVLVTHEPDVAAHAARVLTVRDGLLDSDTASQGHGNIHDQGLRHNQSQRRVTIARRPSLLSRRRSI